MGPNAGTGSKGTITLTPPKAAVRNLTEELGAPLFWRVYDEDTPGIVRCDDEDDAHGIEDNEAGQDIVLEQRVMLLLKEMEKWKKNTMSMLFASQMNSIGISSFTLD